MENSFLVAFEGTELDGDVMLSENGKEPHTLFLHGAGNSNRRRWQPLREALVANGVGSYAFDFIGHGETGGELSSSSLERRTNQVIEVIKTQKIPIPLTLIGSSMGAYTALKVFQKVPVSVLIFLVPAMYSRDLYHVKFDNQFSEIIRKPGSWENSDAWEILETFQGKLLVIGAGKDETVPRKLTQKIYDSARRAIRRELYFVANASHALGKFLGENEEEKGKIVSRIASFCRGS